MGSQTKQRSSPMQAERRRNRRLEISLPVAFSTGDDGLPAADTTTTKNVSTGGVYLTTDQPALAPGRVLNMELTIPPGQGHFPYEGRVTGTGVVVRVEDLPNAPRQWGVAVEFRDLPKLVF
jgi:hypothetical protein